MKMRLLLLLVFGNIVQLAFSQMNRVESKSLLSLKPLKEKGAWHTDLKISDCVQTGNAIWLMEDITNKMVTKKGQSRPLSFTKNILKKLDYQLEIMGSYEVPMINEQQVNFLKLVVLENEVYPIFYLESIKEKKITLYFGEISSATTLKLKVLYEFKNINSFLGIELAKDKNEEMFTVCLYSNKQEKNYRIDGVVFDKKMNNLSGYGTSIEMDYTLCMRDILLKRNGGVLFISKKYLKPTHEFFYKDSMEFNTSSNIEYEVWSFQNGLKYLVLLSKGNDFIGSRDIGFSYDEQITEVKYIKKNSDHISEVTVFDSGFVIKKSDSDDKFKEKLKERINGGDLDYTSNPHIFSNKKPTQVNYLKKNENMYVPNDHFLFVIYSIDGGSIKSKNISIDMDSYLKDKKLKEQMNLFSLHFDLLVSDKVKSEDNTTSIITIAHQYDYRMRFYSKSRYYITVFSQVSRINCIIIESNKRTFKVERKYLPSLFLIYDSLSGKVLPVIVNSNENIDNMLIEISNNTMTIFNKDSDKRQFYFIDLDEKNKSIVDENEYYEMVRKIVPPKDIIKYFYIKLNFKSEDQYSYELKYLSED